jgi:hypothetical protein
MSLNEIAPNVFTSGVLKTTADAIRRITKRAFVRRFTQPERTLIRKSTDDIVIDIYDDLQSVDTVDLDHPDTVASLGYLESVGILGTERGVELLVDGTQEEL